MKENVRGNLAAIFMQNAFEIDAWKFDAILSKSGFMGETGTPLNSLPKMSGFDYGRIDAGLSLVWHEALASLRTYSSRV